ncbi:MAG: O-antigen ligase family protein, partial [candidate division Zixibacteria bacterium]|nr:O-antigen ligase family protein [candidate division Zixibacteria bacterium]
SESSYRLLNDLLFGFFALFIFGSTFSIAIAQISAGLSVALFIIIIILTRYNPFTSSLRWFYCLVGLYIVWLFFTAAIGPTPWKSMALLREDWLFVIVPVGIYLFNFDRYRHKLPAALAAGVLLVSVYGIIQHFTGTHWFKSGELLGAPGHGYRVEGNFSIAITFGNYFGTASLFLLGYALSAGKRCLGKKFFFILSSSTLGIMAAMLSYGRGVIIAVIAALIVMGFMLGRRYLLYAVCFLAMVVAVALFVSTGLKDRFTTQMDTEIKGEYEGSRIFIWKNSLAVIREHPLFGVGAGNFRRAYTSHLRPDIPDSRKHAHAHNDLLNVAAVSGIPGAVIFAALWLATFGYFWKGRRKTRDDPYAGALFLGAGLGSLVFFLSALTEATFADEEVRQMLMFIWAAGLWWWYNSTETDRPAATKRA